MPDINILREIEVTSPDGVDSTKCEIGAKAHNIDVYRDDNNQITDTPDENATANNLSIILKTIEESLNNIKLSSLQDVNFNLTTEELNNLANNGINIMLQYDAAEQSGKKWKVIKIVNVIDDEDPPTTAEKGKNDLVTAGAVYDYISNGINSIINSEY